MKHRLLIESSVLEDPQRTGVGYFTACLAEAMEQCSDDLRVSYLWLNFMGRKRPRSTIVSRAAQRHDLSQLRGIPQRLYAKLVYARLAPPLIGPAADWILFPNFYLWPVLGPARTAVIIHDLCFLVHPEYVEEKNRRFLQRVVTRSIEHADLIIANSQFTNHELQRVYHLPADRIVTIDIPVEPGVFTKDHDKGRAYLASRYGITKNYILTFGTIEPRKNIETLVDAYCALPDDLRQRYSLVLAGKWGWKIEALKQHVAELRAAGYDIIAPGYIEHDDKASFYLNASFYAITSHYEGFGMPLLEALHCGLPTLANDIPVFREVGGDDGCVWASGVTDTTQQLEMLLRSPKLARTVANAGKKRAQGYSWPKAAQVIYTRMFSS